jgi:hypothetical protein
LSAEFQVSGFRLEAEPSPPPVPECVEGAKVPAPSRQVVRRLMTLAEAEMVRAIRRCVTFSVGHWDKRFMRELPEEITERQAVQVWRIFRTYRRQITTGPAGVMSKARKDELLAMAEAVVEAMGKKGGSY